MSNAHGLREAIARGDVTLACECGLWSNLAEMVASGWLPEVKKAVVDGKEPTQAVNLPPSGQAGSSPANGTNQDCTDDAARFDERVACAVLVLKHIREPDSRPASDAQWLTEISKAILARGKA